MSNPLQRYAKENTQPEEVEIVARNLGKPNKGGRPISIGKGATVTLTVRLTREHREQLEAIREERGHASVSETIRALIEGA